MKGSSSIFSSALPSVVHATSSTTPGLPHSFPRNAAEAKAASARKSPREGQKRWTQLTKSPSSERMDQPLPVVQRHMMRAGSQLTISIDLKPRGLRLEGDPRVGASSQSEMRRTVPRRYRLARWIKVFWKIYDIDGHCTISPGSLGMYSCSRGQYKVKTSRTVISFERGYVTVTNTIKFTRHTTLCTMLLCEMAPMPGNPQVSALPTSPHRPSLPIPHSFLHISNSSSKCAFNFANLFPKFL